MAKDDNQKHYFSKCEAEELKEVFSAVAKNKRIVELWKKGMSEDDLESYEPISFNSETLILELKSKGSLLKTIFKTKLKDKEVFFKVASGKFQYFSYSTLRYDDEEKIYSLKIDKDVFRSQQRENYRLKASGYVKIKLKIEEDVFDCLDISAGGTSFRFGDDFVEKFQEGTVFKNNFLQLCNRKHSIPSLKIAKLWQDTDKDGKPTGLHCAGVAFINLPKNIEEDLFIQVNAEARGEEVRKKILSKAKKK